MFGSRLLFRNALALGLLVLLWLVLLPATPLHAQRLPPGNAFAVPIEPQGLDTPLQYRSMLQDSLGVLYFATDFGILRHDGALWQLYTTRAAVQAMAFGGDGRLYVATLDGIGFFDLRVREPRLAPFTPIDYDPALLRAGLRVSDAFRHILKLPDGSLLFTGPYGYLALGLNGDGRYAQVGAAWPDDIICTGSLLMSDEAYAHTQSGKLLHWAGEAWQDKGRHPSWRGSPQLAYDGSGKPWLLDTTRTLWQLAGTQPKAARLSATVKKLLTVGPATSLAIYNDSLLAIGTQNEGLLLVDLASGELLQHLPFIESLGQVELIGLHEDRDGGLWLLSASRMARLALAWAMEDLSIYGGLAGSIQDATLWNGSLYVATTAGLYTLRAVPRQQQEQISPAQQRSRYYSAVRQKYAQPMQAEIDAEVAAKANEQAILDRYLEELNAEHQRLKLEIAEIRNKRKRADAELQRLRDYEYEKGIRESRAAREAATAREAIIARITQEYQQRVEQEVASLMAAWQQSPRARIAIPTYLNAFEFALVAGTDFDCTRLLPAGNRLLVATVNGIFAISGNSGRFLSNQTGIRHWQASASSPNQIYFLTDAGFYSLNGANGRTSRLLAGAYTSFLPAQGGTLWLGTDQGQVLRYSPSQVDTLTLPDNQRRPVQLVQLAGRTLAITAAKLYRFQPDDPTAPFVQDSLLSAGHRARSRYLATNDDLGWMIGPLGVRRLQNTTPTPRSLPHMAYVGQQPLKIIRLAADDYLWVGPSSLLRFSSRQLRAIEPPTPYFLNIYTHEQADSSLLAGRVQCTDWRSVAFSMSQVYYHLPGRSPGMEYQIDGLGRPPSWQPLQAKLKEFAGLGPGEYAFAARPKWLANEPVEQLYFTFSVLPSWWQLHGQWVFVGAGVLLLMMGFMVYRGTRRIIRKREARLKAKYTKDIRQVLYNILPRNIADKLESIYESKGVEGTHYIDREEELPPEYFPLVTVLFTDFKGFTSIATEQGLKQNPIKLVRQLDACFEAFDAIIARHKLEKIKTMGDAYMAAGGIPERDFTNPVQAVLAALDIIRWMGRWRQEQQAQGLPHWEVRVGLHTGDLVAGVIGLNKFAYDVWGDTVNTAARMESTSEEGRLNISSTTHYLVQDFFVCSYRGKVEAKHIGAIDMYFVEGLRPELHLPDEPNTPNERFYRLLEVKEEKWRELYATAPPQPHEKTPAELNELPTNGHSEVHTPETTPTEEEATAPPSILD